MPAAIDRVASQAAENIAVGVFPAPAVGLLPQVLARLRVDAPWLRVRVSEGSYEDLGPALGAGEIDVIIGRLYQPTGVDGFAREAIYDDPVVLLARRAHPMLAHDVSLAIVARYDLIVPPVSRRFGQEVDDLLAGLPDFRPRLLRSTSIGFAREMVIATDSIALAPRMMMAADVARGEIVVVPVELGFPARPSGITYDRGRPLAPGMRAFVTALKDTVVS